MLTLLSVMIFVLVLFLFAGVIVYYAHLAFLISDGSITKQLDNQEDFKLIFLPFGLFFVKAKQAFKKLPKKGT